MNKKEISPERKQSASRLRLIRENAGFTQERFSEILGITLSAYKKLESGENQISIVSLRKLYNEMNVSTDYILYGNTESLDKVWTAVLNCKELDKMRILIRLLAYFTETRKGTFSLNDEQTIRDKEMLQLIKELNGED